MRSEQTLSTAISGFALDLQRDDRLFKLALQAGASNSHPGWFSTFCGNLAGFLHRWDAWGIESDIPRAEKMLAAIAEFERQLVEFESQGRGWVPTLNDVLTEAVDAEIERHDDQMPIIDIYGYLARLEEAAQEMKATAVPPPQWTTPTGQRPRGLKAAAKRFAIYWLEKSGAAHGKEFNEAGAYLVARLVSRWQQLHGVADRTSGYDPVADAKNIDSTIRQNRRGARTSK